MGEHNKVNPEIVGSIKEIECLTMAPGVVKTSGAGKAYQSVAQSMAIAVQDATDHLRNMSTVSSTAIGVAMAQMLADPKNAKTYEQVIKNMQSVACTAAQHFKQVGEDAGDVLTDFPSS